MPAALLALLATTALPSAALDAQASLPWESAIDLTKTSKEFMGLGGLSGGGGTTRLLYDYAEPQRSQVLDALFVPKKGGNVQILKVECASPLFCSLPLPLRPEPRSEA